MMENERGGEREKEERKEEERKRENVEEEGKCLLTPAKN